MPEERKNKIPKITYDSNRDRVSLTVPTFSDESDVRTFLKSLFDVLQTESIQDFDFVETDVYNEKALDGIKRYIRQLLANHPFFSEFLKVTDPSVVDHALIDYLESPCNNE